LILLNMSAPDAEGRTIQKRARNVVSALAFYKYPCGLTNNAEVPRLETSD
jgi:hypothetical protein